MGLTPFFGVTKVFVHFWDLLGAIKKVAHVRYGSCGSYELLVSGVGHQMNEK